MFKRLKWWIISKYWEIRIRRMFRARSVDVKVVTFSECNRLEVPDWLNDLFDGAFEKEDSEDSAA